MILDFLQTSIKKLQGSQLCLYKERMNLIWFTFTSKGFSAQQMGI